MIFMTIEILPIGGFLEVGRNMTAVKVNEDIIILDMGFFLPSLVNFEEEGGDRRTLNREGLIKIGAIPDDTALLAKKENVKAIILGHCHLDHIGATPWLAVNYPQAPILGTPYTIQVLKNALTDDKVKIKNDIIAVQPNHTFILGKNLSVEFIHVNHSTLQVAIVAVHTPEGTIVYANDFKMDDTPVVGKKVNTPRLKELGQENVRCLISNSLYSNSLGKTPSEKVAQQMLKDVLLKTDNSSNAIFTTAFASHIPRLKSLVECGNQLNREVVFLGRSLMKYTKSAQELGLIDFNEVDIAPFPATVRRVLKNIEKNRDKYLVVCTGGQGEPGAVLTRVAQGDYHFNFNKEDHVIFSNRVIPAPTNVQNRKDLEERLAKKGLRVFKDVHVSGHGSREDIRELIKLVKPQIVIPTHGYPKMYEGVKNLANELGYEEGKGLRMAKTGQKILV